MKDIERKAHSVWTNYFLCGYCETKHKSQGTAVRCPKRAQAQRDEKAKEARKAENAWHHDQHHVGVLFGDRDARDERGKPKRTWHTDGDGNFWSGSWHTRTREQLYAEAKTIIEDLEELYPELKNETA